MTINWNDKDVVLAAVTQSGQALQWASQFDNNITALEILINIFKSFPS